MGEINTYDHLNLRDQAERARWLALAMHEGQVDKIGRFYMEHLHMVAAYYEDRARSGGWPIQPPLDPKDEEAAQRHYEYGCGMIAAWLHDIVEDTPVTTSDLVRYGFPAYSVSLVTLMTRSKRISKHLYYGAIKKDPIASMLKSADMDHNSDPLRLAGIEDDAERERLTQKYVEGYRALGTTSRWHQ